MSAQYRERHAEFNTQGKADYEEKEKTVTGTVSGEIFTEFHEMVGQDDKSEAELLFGVTGDNGQEIQAIYRYTVMETDPPKLTAGDPITLYGDRHGDTFTVESYRHSEK